MSKIICPCKDCICFPVCKAQSNEYMKQHSDIHSNKNYGYFTYTDVLGFKCSLIIKWVNNYSNVGNECYGIIHELYKQR